MGYITECKHLLCTRCLQDKMIGNGVINKCLLCHKDKVQTMALDGSVRMPRKVALLLYGNPARTLSEVKEILNFQMSHSDRFVRYVCDSKASIDKEEDELRRLMEENCAIEGAVGKLNTQLKGLKDHNRNQEMALQALQVRRNFGLDAGRVTSPVAIRHPGRNTEMNHKRFMVGRDQGGEDQSDGCPDYMAALKGCMKTPWWGRN